jgi:hypothetical protein
MQPYFFPYIGYFQLVNAVDKFVFYDDVNFIKNGWINRNRILLNNQAKYLTVHLHGASSNKLIHEVGFTDNGDKLKKTIVQAYRKAPQFSEVWPLIDIVLDYNTEIISELAAFTIIKICEYLRISNSFEFSRQKYSDTITLRKEERLIEICKRNNSTEYINPIGGTELYEKAEFANHCINLHFLKTNPIQYRQFSEVFIPNLSIIDVMMFNSIEQIHEMLNKFELI